MFLCFQSNQLSNMEHKYCQIFKELNGNIVFVLFIPSISTVFPLPKLSLGRLFCRVGVCACFRNWLKVVWENLRYARTAGHASQFHRQNQKRHWQTFWVAGMTCLCYSP